MTFWAIVGLGNSEAMIWAALGAVVVIPALVGVVLGRRREASVRQTVVYATIAVLAAVTMVAVIGVVVAVTMEPLGPSN